MKCPHLNVVGYFKERFISLDDVLNDRIAVLIKLHWLEITENPTSCNRALDNGLCQEESDQVDVKDRNALVKVPASHSRMLSIG